MRAELRQMCAEAFALRQFMRDMVGVHQAMLALGVPAAPEYVDPLDAIGFLTDHELAARLGLDQPEPKRRHRPV